MKLKFAGKIEQGEIILDDQHLFDRQKLSLEGKKIEMTLEKYKTQRSLRQNAYYWGVVIPIIGEWTGEYDHNSLHEALKKKFLTSRDIKGLEITDSTTKQSTTEFEIYIEKIRMWLAEDGIQVPEPN